LEQIAGVADFEGKKRELAPSNKDEVPKGKRAVGNAESGGASQFLASQAVRVDPNRE
jgi:hypothetical protein